MIVEYLGKSEPARQPTLHENEYSRRRNPCDDVKTEKRSESNDYDDDYDQGIISDYEQQLLEDSEKDFVDQSLKKQDEDLAEPPEKIEGCKQLCPKTFECPRIQGLPFISV